ncbi:hypothetical protein [Amycolatopsis sp. lyj-84]|uniref:hypothetical protein n=1 Tax=Amycolatopsis sp. lyj-84 TaxID=2789284 RepID=UPI00397902A2
MAVLAMDFIETVALAGVRQAVRIRYVLREYERHYSPPRTHRSLAAAAPLKPCRLEHLVICRQDRLGEVIHEYRLAA